VLVGVVADGVWGGAVLCAFRSERTSVQAAGQSALRRNRHAAARCYQTHALLSTRSPPDRARPATRRVASRPRSSGLGRSRRRGGSRRRSSRPLPGKSFGHSVWESCGAGSTAKGTFAERAAPGSANATGSPLCGSGLLHTWPQVWVDAALGLSIAGVVFSLLRHVPVADK
jgi:hypothetical protein